MIKVIKIIVINKLLKLFTAVIEVSGCWLLKLRDRYSWWHKILPLLLTGLHDELEEIRQKSATFWDAVGQLYIEENQNDKKLKNKLDFLTKNPHHYPNGTFYRS